MFELLKRNSTISEIILENPPANALGFEAVAQLRAAIASLGEDSDVKVAIIRARGRMFCAGADIKMMHQPAGTDKERAKLTDLAIGLQGAFRDLRALPICTIAAVNGTATGGGFELALSCDLRVMAKSAQCGLPEIRLGLVAAAGGTQLISEYGGKPAAMRLILTGDIISAQEAYRLNLVQFLADDGELESFVFALANAIAKFPKTAITANKRCIALSGNARGYEEEIKSTQLLHESEETQKLIANFVLSRRKKGSSKAQGYRDESK